MSNTPATTLALSSMYQDQIFLAGLPNPGVAEFVKPANAPRNWDVRQGYGYSGAFIVYTGDGLAKFSVKLTCWSPPDLFAEWTPFAALLKKPPKGLTPSQLSAFALGISHPLLNMDPINVSSVVVEDLSQWVQDDDGEWTMTIDFLQFRAPAPALGKPDKTIPGIEGKGAEGAAGNFGGDTSPGAATIANLNDQIIKESGP